MNGSQTNIYTSYLALRVLIINLVSKENSNNDTDTISMWCVGIKQRYSIYIWKLHKTFCFGIVYEKISHPSENLSII